MPSLGAAKTVRLSAMFVNAQSLTEDKWQIVTGKMLRASMTMAAVCGVWAEKAYESKYLGICAEGPTIVVPARG